MENYLQPVSDSQPFFSFPSFPGHEWWADSGARGYSDGDDIGLLEAAIVILARKVVAHLDSQVRSYRRVLHYSRM